MRDLLEMPTTSVAETLAGVYSNCFSWEYLFLLQDTDFDITLLWIATVYADMILNS